MTAWRDGRLMATLHKGAAPPSDRPALFTDLIQDASSKGRRQLQAQQEHEQEAGARPSRLPARLDGSPSSCSCSCCAWIWRLRFGQASRIMSDNGAGRSVGGFAPCTGWPSGVHPAHAAITRSRAGGGAVRAVWRWTARIHLEFIRMTGNLTGD